MNNEIICVGEILWDSLPAGLFLGGAPFNVAHDLRRLGNNVRIISRVGKDFLGEEILRRVAKEGIPTNLIKFDDKLPTGFVEVIVNGKGDPQYRICEPVAWDAIEMGDGLLTAVSAARALVFGTLASRNRTSRETIYKMAETASLKVLDVNLRPGGSSRESVEHLLRLADIVKVNSSELAALRGWFGLHANEKDAAEELAQKFSCEVICVSRGAEGGGLWHEGRWVDHPGFKVDVRDSVGAGDAFLAGLLESFLRDDSEEEMIATANLLGAYVATQAGATPEFDPSRLEAFRATVVSQKNTEYRL